MLAHKKQTPHVKFYISTVLIKRLFLTKNNNDFKSYIKTEKVFMRYFPTQNNLSS